MRKPTVGRVAEAFHLIQDIASEPFPWLSDVRLFSCSLVERHHREKWRQFAHANHRKMTICFARAAERELTEAELIGMVAHEFGHLVGVELGFRHHARAGAAGMRKTPKAVQREADEISRRFFGIEIRYNRRTLQEAARIRSGSSGVRVVSRRRK